MNLWRYMHCNRSRFLKHVWGMRNIFETVDVPNDWLFIIPRTNFQILIKRCSSCIIHLFRHYLLQDFRLNFIKLVAYLPSGFTKFNSQSPVYRYMSLLFLISLFNGDHQGLDENGRMTEPLNIKNWSEMSLRQKLE